MQKYIDIDWLQYVDIIQRNALSPYISKTNDVTNKLRLVSILPLYNKLFQKMLLLLKI